MSLNLPQGRSERANRQKLALLGSDRKYFKQSSVLEDYKRVFLLLASGKIPRIHALFAVQMRHGRGVKSITMAIQKALAGTYNPKGYDLEDLENTFLASKLGCRGLAYAQNRSLGIASVSMLSQSPLASIPRFQMSSGCLEECVYVDMRQNMDRFLFCIEAPKERCLYVLMVDDVSNNRRLRPDPRGNPDDGWRALGLCRCNHLRGKGVIKNYQDIVDLKEHLDDEDASPCGGIADEITAVAFGPNCEKDYMPKIVLGSGTCKKGDQVAATALMIEAALHIWNSDPRGYALRGPCPVVWMDGASAPVKAAHGLLESEPLPTSHILYCKFARMTLFNRHFKVVGGHTAVTKGSDPKHTFKCSKSSVKSAKPTGTHGPGQFKLDGTLIKNFILALCINGSLVWTQAQVEVMFKSGFANAQSVPAAVLLIRAIVSLGGRAASDFPSMTSTPLGTAAFLSAKPTLDVLSKYFLTALTLLTKKDCTVRKICNNTDKCNIYGIYYLGAELVISREYLCF